MADSLSRSVKSVMIDDSDILAQYQKQDTTLQHFLKNPKVKVASMETPNHSTIIGDNGLGYFRPYLPVSVRANTIKSLHELAHPGIKATDALVSKRYIWPQMHKDIKSFVRQCVRCQAAKIVKHTKSPLQSIPTTTPISHGACGLSWISSAFKEPQISTNNHW